MRKFKREPITLVSGLLLVSLSLSPIAFAGNEGKTGEGVCAEYVALTNKMAHIVLSTDPKDLASHSSLISGTDLVKAATKLRCVPTEAISGSRAAITSLVDGGFVTTLDWRKYLSYSRNQQVRLAAHELSVGLSWENSDTYDVSRHIAYFFFANLPSPRVQCFESGFDETGSLFTCTQPRVLHSGKWREVLRDSENESWLGTGTRVCKRLGFSESVEVQTQYSNSKHVVALTSEGLVLDMRFYRSQVLSSVKCKSISSYTGPN